MSGAMTPPPRQPVPLQASGGQGGPVGAPMPAPMQAPAPQVPGGPQAGFGGSQPAYLPPPAPSQPIPPPMGAPNPQNVAMFGRAASARPGKVGPGQMRLTSAELAAMGRFGDTTIAHLTPGEIAVPPQVQTPQVKAVIGQAFQQAGVSPAKFVAGSPQASINPQSGVPEYSFWSAILPVIGAAAGSFIPGIGTAAGMAVGGAAGGALGAGIDGGTPMQALLSGLGGAAGGYVGGGGLGSLGGLAGGAEGGVGALTGAEAAAASQVPAAGLNSANPFGVGLNPELGYMGAGAAAPVADPTSASGSLWDAVKGAPWRGAMLSGLGSTAGTMLAPTSPQSSALPPGFNSPMRPLNGNYNTILGNSNNPRPGFEGYNPYAAVTGNGYDFYKPRFA